MVFGKASKKNSNQQDQAVVDGDAPAASLTTDQLLEAAVATERNSKVQYTENL